MRRKIAEKGNTAAAKGRVKDQKKFLRLKRFHWLHFTK